MPNFESALKLSGWGPYYYGLLTLFGFCALSEAAVRLSGPFALPLAMCDLRFPSSVVVWVSSLLSFGMALGGYIVGCMSDVSGRKCVIPLSMLVMFSGAIGSSFSSSSHMLLVCMLLMGIGLGSHSFATRIYLAEALPQHKRGPWLVFLELLWVFGYLIATGLAWLLVPSAIEYSTQNFRPNSWRMMLALSSCICIMVACLTGILSPSPRFLLVKNRADEALEELRHMFAINTSSHVDSFQVPDLTNCVEADPEPPMPGALCTEYISHSVKRMKRLTARLMKKRYRKRTILCVIISIALFPGIVVASIWTRHIMHWSGSYTFTGGRSNDTCNVTTIQLMLTYGCDGISSYFFIEFMYMAVAMILADIILIFLIDRAGHKWSLGTSFIIASVCSSILPFKIPNLLRIILCCLFMASYTTASTAFMVITVEIYPTPIRATANGLIPLVSRLLSMLMKLFLDTSCEISLFVTAGMTLVAAALSLFLPDLTRKPMEEGFSQPDAT